MRAANNPAGNVFAVSQPVPTLPGTSADMPAVAGGKAQVTSTRAVATPRRRSRNVAAPMEPVP